MVLLFAAISFAYFYPADTEGRILYQHDSSAGRGMGEESREYKERTGETTRWTNSLFAGMPTYQSAPSYDSTTTLGQAMKAYHLWLPDYVWYVFVYLLGFYILLRSFDFKWYLASLGAIIWAFSSYFFIIIAAGHYWKVMALAYLPPLLGGIFLAYRGKYLPAFILAGIFTAFEINANHVQMTYYYAFIIFFLVVAFLIDAIRQKKIMQWVKASAVCLIAGALGIMTNISNLYHTWEYQNESMRGKSELVKKDAADQTSSGLERSYITQWSYGIDETWTLLIPNTKGGSSMTPISQSSAAREKADPMFMQIYQQMGQYWGTQPGTSGPVYVGAFVIMLFFLGLFIVKGPIKWALLASTILSIMLSWGHNMMWFTDLFIDYMPMYAKFRTVASILVIAEFTIPLLAILALHKVITEPESLTGNLHFPFLQKTFIPSKAGGAMTGAFLLSGGFCLLFAMMPAMFFDSFISPAEMRALSQIPQESLTPLLSNLKDIRIATFTADCWRSFFIILLCSVVLIAFRMKKLSAPLMMGIITVICLVDMWQVNKRYLNDDMFVSNTLRSTPIEPTPTDQEILKDKSLDYRVLNLASNTFNENETSYFHKSIGGYHAAKLRRYQELIEAHIAPEMEAGFSAIAHANGEMSMVNGDSIMPVLNMLNTKYLILPLQGGQTMPLQNPYAMGNGWFVNKVEFVDNANAELDALNKINLHTTAVAEKKFSSILTTQQTDSVVGTVTLTAYEPNELHYDINSNTGGIVVFSEIYYPGWTCTVDGEPIEVGRVNYVLRAINIMAGSHKVVMEFKPQSLRTTETIAYAALITLILSIIAVPVVTYIRSRK